MDNYMYGKEVAEGLGSVTAGDEDYTSPFTTIPTALYESLLEDAAWLRALEDAGVDNWCGYDFARELFNEANEEEGEEENA